jgi:hypothetical protein
LIGKYTSGNFFGGYIDEFRIVKRAEWESNFTTPTVFYPWGSNDEIEGRFITEGIKYESIYTRDFLRAHQSDQKITVKYCSVKDYYKALNGRRLTLYNNLWDNNDYWIGGDNFHDSRTYTGGTWQYNLVINSYSGMVYDVDSGGVDDISCTFNTFYVFGDFEIDTPKGITFRYNMLSSPTGDDFGNIEADGTVVKTGNIYSNVLTINDVEIGTYNETPLFRSQDDYRLRDWRFNYKIYNTLVTVGAYNVADTKNIGSAEYYDLPKPSEVEYEYIYERKVNQTAIDSTYYRETDTPILKVTLAWNDGYIVTFDDVQTLHNLNALDDWLECFLFGVQEGGTVSSPEGNYRVTLAKARKEWIGRIYYQNSNYIHHVTSVTGDVMETSEYPIAAFRYYSVPDASDNTLRGYPVYIEPFDLKVKGVYIDDSVHPDAYKIYNGLQVTLIVDLNHDFINE